MKKREYHFISLERALTDEVYRLPEAQSRHGLPWLYRWMPAIGRSLKGEPSEPAIRNPRTAKLK